MQELRVWVSRLMSKRLESSVEVRGRRSGASLHRGGVAALFKSVQREETKQTQMVEESGERRWPHAHTDGFLFVGAAASARPHRGPETPAGGG